MKRAALSGLICGVSLFARSADATEAFLCCGMAGVGTSGPCVAQSAACSSTSAFSVGLSNLAPSASASSANESCALPDGADWAPSGAYCAPPTVADPSFPSGTDGYVYWSANTPRVGFCLDAPSAQDPTHAGPTEPIGCISLSLDPGVGAQIEQLEFPVDSRWDAYQLCYGPKAADDCSSNATLCNTATPDPCCFPCANVNDLDDRTIAATPVSSSCCGPPQLLRNPQDIAPSGSSWSVAIGPALPGVPPLVVGYSGGDGGIILSPAPDASPGTDYFTTLPAVCLSAYNEPSSCGSPPAASAAATTTSASPDASLDAPTSSCVPTTCAAQGVTCAQIPDGCGGMLNCVSDCTSSTNCAMSRVVPAKMPCGWRVALAFSALLAVARRRAAKRRGAQSLDRRRPLG